MAKSSISTSKSNDKTVVKKQSFAKASSNKPIEKYEAVEKKIIRVVAELRVVLRKDDVPKKLLVVMSGYSHMKSKGFAKAITKLTTDGIVQRSPSETGSVQFTKRGVELISPECIVPSIHSNSQVQERLLEIIYKKKGTPVDRVKKIWNCLLDGRAHSIPELLTASGYNHTNSKGFANMLSNLKELELTTQPGNKMLKLTDLAFPFGRPGCVSAMKTCKSSPVSLDMEHVEV
jgi:hypothetical protein